MTADIDKALADLDAALQKPVAKSKDGGYRQNCSSGPKDPNGFSGSIISRSTRSRTTRDESS